MRPCGQRRLFVLGQNLKCIRTQVDIGDKIIVDF